VSSPLAARIASWQRDHLERLSAPSFDATALDGFEPVRVRGLAAARRNDMAPTVAAAPFSCDFAVSAHGHGDRIVVVITGAPRQTAIYVGLDGGGASGRAGDAAAATARLLHGAYPGAIIDDGWHHDLGSELRPLMSFGGMLAGVPGRPESKGTFEEATGLSRVLRGMRGAAWALVVRASPVADQTGREHRDALLQEIGTVSPLARQSVQRSRQETVARTEWASQSSSEMMTGEWVDREAQYLVDLLHLELQRLDEARALGRWQVAVHFGASERREARRLGALLRGLFAAAGVAADPLRVIPASGSGAAPEATLHTLLSSRELSLLIDLPREEAPGYRIADVVSFDVDVPRPEAGVPVLELGEIVHDDADTGIAYAVRRDDLTRHALVAGVTGSGKTTTICAMLRDLDRAGIPFLVIEPAKTEYRALLGRIRGGAGSGLVPDLRVYTLGNDGVAPFRLNPFEFETDSDPAHSLLGGHIDLLKAVFNAAFVLYAPMPYVLEIALNEVYEDRGWSLATGQNLRLPAGAWAQRDRHPIFPTLGDLSRKVEDVTRRLGYEARIEQDVVAGLKARIASLRVGAKGLMLDVPRGTPVADLLTRPVVLELESLGNDSEKAFIAGLLLARVYERRRLHPPTGASGGTLQHVIVIEEAHRLLRRVDTDVDTESSNLRAQAVETLVNMLSEVRRYGQGVVLAEQVPTKLAPDAIKNTNLKLIHRIVAEDDRTVLAGATNMTPSQSRHLATLAPGDAVVFAEPSDHPSLLRVPDALAKERFHPPSDRELSALAPAYVALGATLAVRDLQRFGILAGRFGGPDPLTLERATGFLRSEVTAAAWAQLLLRTSLGAGPLRDALAHLERAFHVGSPDLTRETAGHAFRLALVLGSAEVLAERAARYGWGYPATAAMHEPLARALIELANSSGSSTIATTHLTGFVASHRPATTRAHGPFPGCRACPAVCRFGPDVDRMMSRDTVRLLIEGISDERSTTALQRYSQVGARARALAEQWCGAPHAEPGVAYCAVLTAAAAAGLGGHQQAEVAHQVAAHTL
jgi:DNA helicase HerA-like ATPase